MSPLNKLKCEYCKKKFKPKHKDELTCSPECFKQYCYVDPNKIKAIKEHNNNIKPIKSNKPALYNTDFNLNNFQLSISWDSNNYHDPCTYKQIEGADNWNRQPKPPFKGSWKKLKQKIPGKKKLWDWKPRSSNPFWKQQNSMQKKFGRKNLNIYYESLPKKTPYKLERLEVTSTSFCLNPPFDKGKKLYVPYFIREDGVGDFLGKGKHGMRNIDVRSTHIKGKIIHSYWKDEHHSIIKHDEVINDTPILRDDRSNRPYTLNQQGQELGLLDHGYIAEPTHNPLKRKVGEMTFIPGDWNKEKIYINTELKRINAKNNPKYKIKKNSEKLKLDIKKNRRENN